MVFKVPSSSEILYFIIQMVWIEEKKWVFEYEEDFPGTQFFYFETGDQGTEMSFHDFKE